MTLFSFFFHSEDLAFYVNQDREGNDMVLVKEFCWNEPEELFTLKRGKIVAFEGFTRY